MTRTLAFSLALLISNVASAAPLGSTITYQGQLTEAGIPASGSYDFQLCLFDSLSAPANAICVPDFADVPVQDGVFTLEPDFGTGLFTGQQRYLEIRVRDGDSTGGYTTLSPRQALRAAPEAQHAGTVPWQGILGVPEDFADGTDDRGIVRLVAGAGLDGGVITATGTLSVAAGGIVQSMLAAGAVGPVQLAGGAVGPAALQAGAVGPAALQNGAVGGAQLADAAVGSAKLAPQAVGSAQLAPAAVTSGALAVAAVTTAALADASVTRPKIAPGAIGAAQIDPQEIQLRLSGSCAAGEYLRGFTATGALICDALPIAVTRTLETMQAVSLPTGANYTAVGLLSDGRPLVAYYATNTQDLKLYVCANASCSSGSTRTLDATGNVGNWVSMAIRSGDRALIAYYSATDADLKVYDCNDADCTSGTARVADGVGSVGGYTSLALRSDNGVIAYYDQTNNDLKIYFCANYSCNSGTIFHSVNPGYIGQGNALALRPNGNAAVVNYAVETGRLAYEECVDYACTSMSGAVLQYDSGGWASYNALAFRQSGRPLVALYDRTSGQNDLAIFDCSTANCGAATKRKLDTAGDVGENVSMVIGPDLIPMISYYDRSNGALKFYRCADINCASGGASTLDDLGNVGIYSSIAVRSDGRPVISYWDVGNGAVKLHICANPECR